MPSELRRQWSDCSSSGDSADPWHGFGECATPACVSPPKRRRLVIRGVASPGDKARGRAASASFQKSLWSTEDLALNTPSRADGICQRAESIGRLHVCDLARQFIRGLLGSGDASLDEARLQAQVMACYVVQVLFMVTSLHREDPDAVAAAAALMGLKAVRTPYRVDDILQVQGMLRRRSGADPVAREQVFKVELRLVALLRCFRGCTRQSRPALRFLGPVAGLVERLARRLPESEAFVASCGSWPAATVARDLEPQLLQVTRCFVADAMQGHAPLLVVPQAVAAGALLLATRFELRRTGHAVGGDELLGLVHAAGLEQAQEASPWSEGSPVPAPEPPTQAEVRRAVQAILEVFKLVGEVQGDKLGMA